MRFNIVVVTLAGLMYAGGVAGQQAETGRDRVAGWLDRYGAAWENRDAEAAAELFTADAEYYETPRAMPFVGQAGIAEYWSTVTADQRDVEFTSRVLAVDGNIGVAEWSATFTSVSTGATIGLDGVFVLEFDNGWRCSELREWWLVRADD